VSVLDMASAATRRVNGTFEILAAFASDPIADLSLLEQGLTPRITPPSATEERIIERLLVSYTLAKRAQESVSEPYRPGGEWAPDIARRRADYLEALRRQDPEALRDLLRSFFRNSGISGLWVYGYYDEIAHARTITKKWFVNSVLRDVAIWRDLVPRSRVADLAVPLVGNPWGYMVEGHLVTPVSPRHHYYANHISNIVSGVQPCVVAEIGGGFGGFAYYLLRLIAHRHLTYLNFDLPEVLLIAGYYLMSAFPEKRVLLFGELEDSLLTEDRLRQYEIVLLPNFELDKLVADSVDVFVNTGSLSEMDYATVEEYLFQITRACKRYFFHENSDREDRKGNAHVEVASSQFPISPNAFKRIYKAYTAWGGGNNRYREHLYQKL
jgi:hypothetical protein